jgi:hypothetical protein
MNSIVKVVGELNKNSSDKKGRHVTHKVLKEKWTVC